MYTETGYDQRMARDADLHLRLRPPRKERLRQRTAHLSGGMSEAIDSLIAWYLREPGAKLPKRPPIPEPADEPE